MPNEGESKLDKLTTEGKLLCERLDVLYTHPVIKALTLGAFGESMLLDPATGVSNGRFSQVFRSKEQAQRFVCWLQEQGYPQVLIGNPSGQTCTVSYGDK